MKKIKLLLFTLVMCTVVTKVEANEMHPIIKKLADELNTYSYSTKYVEMPEVIEFLKNGDGDGARIISNNDPYAIMLTNLVKGDLEKHVDLSQIDGIDMACYIEGNTYSMWDEETLTNVDRVADSTYCSVYFYHSIEDSLLEYHKTIPVTFTKVERNEDTYKKTFELVKQLNKSVYVYDIDVLNHYLNYQKNSSSFFSSNNALYEFAELKKVKEANPEFNIFIGFEDTRRGIGNVGIAEGSTFVAKNDVIYGFTYNSYNVGNVFVVPYDTPEADFETVLEKRLNDYAKGLNATIAVLPYDSEYLTSIYDSQDTIPKLFGIDPAGFYINAHTTAEIQKAKVDSAPNTWGCNIDQFDTCIASYVRKLKINDIELEIDIVPYDFSKLKNLGTISSIDPKTGVMLESNANNIPLDASLNTKILELSEEDKNSLKENGFDVLGGYGLALYSKILDKYISQFNSPTKVLIPKADFPADIEIVFLDDNNKVENFPKSVETINDVEYFVFITNHFSNYYFVKKAEVANPKTSDSINYYLLAGTISLISLAGLGVYRKKELLNKAN